MGFNQLPHWMRNNKTYHKDLVNGGEMKEVSPLAANLISSEFYTDPETKEEYHYPVLDIDMEAQLIPSTSSGHYHLYIHKKMTKEAYGKLLEALVEAGIVQQGILDLQWKAEGMTAARMPGEKKEVNSPSSGGKVTGGLPAQFDLLVPDDSFQPVKISTGSISAGKIIGEAKLKVKPKSEFALAAKNIQEEIEPALQVFERLSKIASESGLAFKDVMEAWKSFSESPNDEPSAKQNHKSTGFQPM